MDEGNYCYKITTIFLLDTLIVFSSVENFLFRHCGSESISSVLLTCLLHGLPKTVLAEKILESNCF